MSETVVSNTNGRQSVANAGGPAKGAAGIVLGALVLIIALRRGFTAVTVKIGA